MQSGSRVSKKSSKTVDSELLKETVINISAKELSDDQIGVLYKGLSFVPTSGINSFGLKVELFKCFYR